MPNTWVLPATGASARASPPPRRQRHKRNDTSHSRHRRRVTSELVFHAQRPRCHMDTSGSATATSKIVFNHGLPLEPRQAPGRRPKGIAADGDSTGPSVPSGGEDVSPRPFVRADRAVHQERNRMMDCTICTFESSRWWGVSASRLDWRGDLPVQAPARDTGRAGASRRWGSCRRGSHPPSPLHHPGNELP